MEEHVWSWADPLSHWTFPLVQTRELRKSKHFSSFRILHQCDLSSTLYSVSYVKKKKPRSLKNLKCVLCSQCVPCETNAGLMHASDTTNESIVHI